MHQGKLVCLETLLSSQHCSLPPHMYKNYTYKETSKSDYQKLLRTLSFELCSAVLYIYKNDNHE